MGDIEAGTCDICKAEDVALQRKYYHYDIKCECCNRADDPHFEIVRYCSNCQPKPPYSIKVMVKPIENGR